MSVLCYVVLCCVGVVMFVMFVMLLCYVMFYVVMFILSILSLGYEIPLELIVQSLNGENVEYKPDYDDLNSPAAKEFVDKFEKEVRLKFLYIYGPQLRT